MKRTAIAWCLLAPLLALGGCSGGIFDTRPPCAEVTMGSTKDVDKGHGNRLVTITFDLKKNGRAYALAREGSNSSIDLTNETDNPLEISLPEGDYILYGTRFDYRKCNDRFKVPKEE